MSRKLAIVAAAVGVLLFLAMRPLVHAAEPSAEIRLYALNGGHIEIPDMGFFSDTGEGAGKPGRVVASSFLIRHPKGDLLWDTGLDDAIAAKPEGVSPGPGFRRTVPVRLQDQLQSLGVTPPEIEFMAFSHMHADHTGNANLFTKATWLLVQRELDWANGTPTPMGVEPATFSAYKTASKQIINGDHDVFGDGKVRILKAPGHTPGHQVLVVSLKKAGTVVLSGDLWHTRLNAKNKLVPAFNASRADTLASFDRIDRIIKNTHARLIIQHSEEDFATLPKLPQFMQ